MTTATQTPYEQMRSRAHASRVARQRLDLPAQPGARDAALTWEDVTCADSPFHAAFRNAASVFDALWAGQPIEDGLRPLLLAYFAACWPERPTTEPAQADEAAAYRDAHMTGLDFDDARVARRDTGDERTPLQVWLAIGEWRLASLGLHADGSGYWRTLPEAADDLGVTPSAMQAAVRRGTLHAEKFGRDWLVTAGEVERYRAEHLGQRGRPNKTSGPD